MDIQTILAKLRHGTRPEPEEMTWAAGALADGTLSDAQAGAFAMGICLVGLSQEACVALTLGMRDTGSVLEWDVEGPVLDKHSTGGVGDCVSLILAPALAVCGAYVPMISGRGLGHTGGTLDKMEAIPGVSVTLDQPRLHRVIKQTGCAIVGATGDIAPADRRLYAVRDVTSTVDSLDLITSSILSKKLAAGLQGLVLDVKLGSGAFMKTQAEAKALAQTLVKTANAAGCKTTALITDMNQPLVPALGNALEVAEVMRVLTGNHDVPIVEVCSALGGALLVDGGLAKTASAGATAVRAAITSGQAAERFGKMLAAVGGPVKFVETWQRFLPEANVLREVKAPTAGIVQSMDGTALGNTVVDLGGGRRVETDVVNPAVGLSNVLRLGAKVNKGDPLAVIHAARPEDADRAAKAVIGAIQIGGGKITPPELIVAQVT